MNKTIFILDAICALLWGGNAVLQILDTDSSLVLTIIYAILCIAWSFKSGMDVVFLYYKNNKK